MNVFWGRLEGRSEGRAVGLLWFNTLALHLLVSTISPTPALIDLHYIRTEGDLSDLNGFGRKQAHQTNKFKSKKKKHGHPETRILITFYGLTAVFLSMIRPHGFMIFAIQDTSYL